MDESGPTLADLSLAETWAELEQALARVSPAAATVGRLSYYLGCAMTLRVLSLYAGLESLGGRPDLPDPAELIAQWRYEISQGMPRDWPSDATVKPISWRYLVTSRHLLGYE